MNPRFLAGAVSLAFISAASASSAAAPDAPLTAASSTIVASPTTFVIQNAAGQVTVTDEAGKALVSVRSATPTIRAIVTIFGAASVTSADHGNSKI